MRVGSTNRRADREVFDELRRFARGETFDEQAMPECDSEAIDFRRKATLAEPPQQAIYEALGIDSSPGGIQKTLV